MSVKYKLIQRKSLRNPNEPEKFYAIAKADGEVSFRRLSKEISTISTTVSDTDVLAVLNLLGKVLVNNLNDGKIVRFGDFGSFQVSISSKGSDTKEGFNASMIRGSKIVFRPGIDLKDMLAAIKYEKHSKE